MSDKPSIGIFKILSLTEGNPPASVNKTFIPYQHVGLNGSQQLWKIRELEVVGDDRYRVRFAQAVDGYDYTGVWDGVFTASMYHDQDIEWIVTYREYNKAYTIAPFENPGKGWTASTWPPFNPQIVIKEFNPTDAGMIKLNQLWRFERVEEPEDGLEDIVH